MTYFCGVHPQLITKYQLKGQGLQVKTIYKIPNRELITYFTSTCVTMVIYTPRGL